MVLKGIVKGNAIELEGDLGLPEGTEVEVVVREPGTEKAVIGGYHKGSPQAILGVWESPPQCSPDDVELLMKEIEQGKRPVRKRLWEQWFGELNRRVPPE